MERRSPDFLSSYAATVTADRDLFDNFEHLLDAAPGVAETIGSCPQLTVLVTLHAETVLGRYSQTQRADSLLTAIFSQADLT